MESRSDSEMKEKEEEKKEKMETEQSSQLTAENKKLRKRSIDKISESTSNLPTVFENAKLTLDSESAFFNQSDSSLNKQIVSLEENIEGDILSLDLIHGMTENINSSNQSYYMGSYLRKADNHTAYHRLLLTKKAEDSEIQGDNDLYYDARGKPLDGHLYFVIVYDPETKKAKLRIGNTSQGHFYLALDEKEVKIRVDDYKKEHSTLTKQELDIKLLKDVNLLKDIKPCVVLAAGELHFKAGRLPRMTVKAGAFFIPLDIDPMEYQQRLDFVKKVVNLFPMLAKVSKQIFSYEEIKQLDAKHAAKKQKTTATEDQSETNPNKMNL